MRADMPSDLIDLIGYLAAVLTTLSFVPQVVKTWRSKSAGDLSLGMLAMFTLGVLLWVLYGFGLGLVPVIAANGVTLVLTTLLVVLTLRGRRAAGGLRPPR